MKKKFNIGDRVALVRNQGMNAAIGSKATVDGYSHSYLRVTWDKDILDYEGNPSGQVDGGYLEKFFELIEQDWDE